MDNVIVHCIHLLIHNCTFGSLGLITSHKSSILALIVFVALQVCMQIAKCLFLDNLCCGERA